MITFVSTYPTAASEKDGMVQRIAAIDRIVADEERVYLDIAVRGHVLLKKSCPAAGVTWYQVNLFLHCLLLLRLLFAADKVYVHSVFAAIRIFPAYFFRGIITDMHGIVPEETLLLGFPWRARLFGWIERIVVKKSAVLVLVTEAMRRHFAQKYGQGLPPAILLPIFDPALLELPEASAESVRDPRLAIYVGGLQAWQNIPSVLAAARQNTAMRYQFLTAEVTQMQMLLQEAGIADADVLSVSRGQVGEYCQQAAFGFVLRDDITVNRVACPTKLIEYLGYGVIPVVLSPDIGDFRQLGYTCVRYEDFCANRLPDAEQLELMREANFAAIRRLKQGVAQGRRSLGDELRGRRAPSVAEGG